MPKVFISFDYKDINSKKVVDNWMNQNIGLDISFSSEEGLSHSAKGEDFVRQLIREKINQSQVVLVLVGDNTHNRPWVDYEVHHAKSHRKRVIWTQLPGTRGSTPKEIGTMPGVLFELNSIQSAIRG